MASQLQKQITNARKQKDMFEEHIHGLLKEHNMANAVIQVSGGQLQLQEETSTGSITMKSLQASTESFFKEHPEIPNSHKMANELLQHIKQSRTVTTSLRLKKLKVQPPVENTH